MKFRSLITGLAVMTLSIGPAFAQDGGAGTYTHEITGATDSTLSFSEGQTDLGINAGYYYFVLPEHGLEVGVSTQLQYQKISDATTATWLALFGVRYSLPTADEVTRQFFVDLGAGFNYSDAIQTSTDFAYGLGVGKRFEISNNITYSPSIAMQKVGDDSAQFEITLLAFSLLF